MWRWKMTCAIPLDIKEQFIARGKFPDPALLLWLSRSFSKGCVGPSADAENYGYNVWNDQEVNRGTRIDIPKHHRRFISVEEFSGFFASDDFTEEVILFHGLPEDKGWRAADRNPWSITSHQMCDVPSSDTMRWGRSNTLLCP